MDPITIGLTQSEADAVYTNGHYHVTLKRPVTITDGAQISARLGSFDTQLSDQSTVIIPTNTALSMEFGYYDCDYSNENKYEYGTANPWPNPTFNLYVAYNKVGYLQLDSAWVTNANVEPYVGQSGFLFAYTFIYFSWIDQNGVRQTMDPGSNTFYYAQNGGTTPFSAVYKNEYGVLPPIIFKIGSLQIIQMATVAAFVSSHSPSFNDPSQFSLSNSTTVPIGGPVEDTLYLNNHIFNLIPGQRYDSTTFADLITRDLQNSYGVEPAAGGGAEIFTPQNKILIRADDQNNNEMYFKLLEDDPPLPIVPTAANSYTYGDRGAVPPGHYPIGAALIDIAYGDQGNVFTLANAHTPPTDPANAASKAVAYYRFGVPPAADQYYPVTTQTGIYIVGLNPPEFWQSIGFYDNIITPLYTDANGMQYPKKTTFKYVQEFKSVSQFVPNFIRPLPAEPLADNPYYAITTDVPAQGLIGSFASGSYTSGIVQVDVLGLPAIHHYIDGTVSTHTPLMIASTQWDTNSFLSAWSESALAGVYHGVPTQLSSFTVRITDPSTGDTIPQLGPNNAIYIDIINQPPDQSTAPVKQNKKSKRAVEPPALDH